MTDWLSQWNFTRFVTLTLNQPGEGASHKISSTTRYMRERLKQFDARMNRKLIGRDYYKRPYNRMFHFFAPEKIAVNPHWHGVISFHGAQDTELKRQEKIFDNNIERIWHKLVPSGTVDVKTINDIPDGISYVAKSLCMELNFEHCILPDELWAK